MKRLAVCSLITCLSFCAVANGQSGTITTIAGDSNGGYSGDGGPAISAQMSGPSGLAMDGSGNLFIADTGNNVIRKVTPGGIITTYAGNGNAGYSGDGGPATAAALNIDIDPIGIAVDAAGNLYIADSLNNRVRKVSAATGIITTVAGNGFGVEEGIGGFSGDGGQAISAELFAPVAVAVDAAGNLFIADLGNMRVRKVSTGGVITTVAGSGCTLSIATPDCGGFSGDGGQATAATLNRPAALAVDGSGNLFIADNENNRIRKVSASGIITTIAGSGTVCVFSSDTCTGSYSGDGGPATSATLNFPEGLTLDSSGNLIIGDTGNLRVRKITGGIITTIAGNGVFDRNIFDPAGDGGPATSAELNLPEGVIFDASGNLFISDNLRSRVRKVLNGVPSPVISSLSPSSATAGGAAFTLTVTGSGFITGSTVQWNGSALFTIFDSTSQIAAPISASLIASAGSVSVIVLNTGGTASNAAAFTINPPTPPTPSISGLSPNSATAGGPAFTLTVNGSGFIAASTVRWNGSAIPTTYVSPSRLSASISANLIATQATVSVTVFNAGAPVSNASPFTVNPPAPPTPSISSLSPNSVTAGGPAFTLTVNGSGFVSGSNVQWNGSAVATSYISASQLSANIPASLIASQAAENVTVVTGGTTVSSPVTFVVFSSSPNTQTISHIPDGDGWRSIVILENTATVPALYAVNFWSDSGASYAPPLALGATTGSIPVGGSTIIETADTAAGLTEGWAEVTSSQALGGTAIFRYDPWSQEAAVPLLASGGVKLEIPYQVGSGLSLGVALANPSATQTANLTEIIRDQNGNQLASRAFTLAALNHTAFSPAFPDSLAAGGVVEYDSNVNIFALGIRGSPEGTGLAFTSLDAVLPLAASARTISHFADGGGWRSSIILMNTDTVPASYAVNFWSDSGASYVPPLALGSRTGSIPVGGSTIVETADTDSNLTEGWAEVTSSQAIGGTAIFRYDPWSQEAAVPLLASAGVALEIPYQVGSGLSLGVALANPSATQTANITEIIRDQNGNQLASRTLTVAPLNHTAFSPAFPAGIAGGGVVEYDSNVNIFALGIRSSPEGAGLAFTSVRAAYK